MKAQGVWRLSDALGVPEELLLGSANEAMQWVIDNGLLDEPPVPDPAVVVPMVAGSSIGANDNDTLLGDFA